MEFTYYVTCNLTKDRCAIKKLLCEEKKSIVLTNKPHQIHFLGILLLHHCFENLTNEFSGLITSTVLDVDSSIAALWSARKLGYTAAQIKHNFKSPKINAILAATLIKQK
jgi:hypothetical protein